MFFKKKVYPILPTSESDTMTFIQKLDYLEYRVNQLNEKVVAAESAISDLETAVEGKSTVSATAEGSTLQTLTVDGTTYDVPQGTEVSATDDEGVLQTLTIGSNTYIVPQGGEGERGLAITSGGLTHSMFQWRLINQIFVIEFLLEDVSDALDNAGIPMQLKDHYNNNWTGLDGMTLKSSISWIHDFGIGGAHDYAPVTAEIQLAVSSDGGCNLSAPKGFTVPTGYTPFAATTALEEIGGMPIVFMTVGLV